MPLTLPTWVRALLLVAAVVTLAGCGALFGDDPELPAGDEAVETYESLDAYNASFVQEVTDENGTDRWEGTYTHRPDTHETYQQLETPDGEQLRYVYADGVEWIHNLDNNTVTKRETAPNQLMSEQIRQIVNSANAGEDDSGESVLPVGPLFPSTDGSASDAATIGPNEVSHDGTETVAGREVHVISITTAEEPDRFEQQLYLDTEWYVVLKATTTAVEDGERTETRLEYTDVEYEPELPDEYFEFEPPSDATVEQPSMETAIYSDPDELRDAAAIRPPEADIPSEFDFLQAYHNVGPPEEFALEPTTDTTAIEQVALQYTSDTSGFAIAKANTTFEEAPGADPVSIGDRTGTYRLVDGQGVVSWECDGTRYSVAGELVQSELIAIAESIECR